MPGLDGGMVQAIRARRRGGARAAPAPAGSVDGDVQDARPAAGAVAAASVGSDDDDDELVSSDTSSSEGEGSAAAAAVKKAKARPAAAAAAPAGLAAIEDADYDSEGLDDFIVREADGGGDVGDDALAGRKRRLVDGAARQGAARRARMSAGVDPAALESLDRFEGAFGHGARALLRARATQGGAAGALALLYSSDEDDADGGAAAAADRRVADSDEDEDVNADALVVARTRKARAAADAAAAAAAVEPSIRAAHMVADGDVSLTAADRVRGGLRVGGQMHCYAMRRPPAPPPLICSRSACSSCSRDGCGAASGSRHWPLARPLAASWQRCCVPPRLTSRRLWLTWLQWATGRLPPPRPPPLTQRRIRSPARWRRRGSLSASRAAPLHTSSRPTGTSPRRSPPSTEVRRKSRVGSR